MSNYTDASLIYYPSGYKAGTAYSLKPTDGSGDLTFTRASSATRVNEQGLIETASVLGSELIPTQASIVNFGGGTITQILGNSYSSTSNGTGTTIRPKVDVAVTIGKKYKLIITPIGSISGVINFDLYDGTSYVFNNYDFSTVKEVIFNANASSIFLAFDGTLIYSISNFTISIKEVIENNIPRIDYSNGCGELLLEPQRTNLALYSSEFDNAGGWTSSATNVTANQTTSPDGTTNADKLERTNTGGYISQNLSLSGTQTYSVFFKKGDLNFGRLLAIGTGNPNVYFDLQNGSVETETNATGSIENYGNGWYRCTITCNITTTAVRVYPVETDGSTVGALGYIYAYGFQAELGSYPTSYIPTSGTAVTRVADSASVTTPAGVTQITETFADGSTNVITSIPSTYTASLGQIQSVIMI